MRKVTQIQLCILFVFNIVIATSSILAQSTDGWGLELSGKVVDDANGKDLEGVLITLFQDKTEINKLTTVSNGAFSFRIPADNEYTLVFSKNGYTSKILSINTMNVPKEISDKTSVFNYRGAKVYLFEVIPDLDVSILEQPIGKIYFDPSSKNFDYDKQYTKSIKTKVEVLSKALEEKKQKESHQAAIKVKQNTEFNKIISEGDLSLSQKKFDHAELQYKKALLMNIDNDLCNSKINGVKEARIADDLAKKKQEFNSYLAAGDAKLNEKKFADAIKEYQKAVAMNFDNPAAEAKIKTCKQTEFDGYLKSGDDILAQKQFDNAVKEYSKALAMNYDNPTAESKINQAKNANSRDAFDKIIAAGDAKLNEKKFADAIKEYQKAVAMNFDNPAAEAKIKTCKQTEFDGYLKSGDDILAQKQFDNAVKEYSKALAMNYDNPTAESKINQAKNANSRAAFDKIISDGDAKLSEKKYSDAIKEYEKALAMDVDKPAAEAKIKTCKQTEFDGYLKSGDDILAQKQFDNAVKEYSKALAMNYDNPTAESKINQAKNANSRAAFDKIISDGDAKLSEKKYSDAIKEYEKALAMDVDKPAAEAKIKTCKQTEFDGYLKSGDDILAQKQFDNAVKEYSKALAMNYDNPTAESKINQAKNANSRDAFDKIIAAGDAKLNEKKFADAIKEYQKAVAMNFDNPAAEAKIKTCKQTEFDGYLKSGDDILAQKQFDNAVKEYSKALAMNYDNPTAESKINQAKNANSRDAFDKIIAAGDAKLNEKKYSDAIKEYEKALAMDVDKPAAEAKIKTCKQTEFDGYLKSGDDILAQKQFDNAVKEYSKALAMNYDNPTAESKINQAKNANSRDAFDKIIAAGDAKLNEKKYSDAIKEYQKAVAMNFDNPA
ncbi:MAG: carboxypeptidase regulatory-like domain-containing protein, partial [Bacteroidia bacterium]|nr:carboxypeptidase regulatory-like domain-containing protein [Bacteroidia bacterium]